MHVAFIGIDGAGKTSLSKLVAVHLESNGYDTELVRMKKNNNEVIAFLEQHNPSLMSEELKLTASTFDLLRQYIKVSDKQHDFVLWDRFTYCLNAYFSALNIDLPWQKKVMSAIKKPDYVFMLDVSPRVAVERIVRRGGKLKALENEHYLIAVREAYLRLHDEQGFILLNSELPLEILKQEVLLCLKDRL